MRNIKGMVAASVALLVGFFVLVIGTVVAFVALAVYGLSTGHVGGGAKLLVLAGALGFALGAAAWRVRKARAEPVGPRIERGDQPELWSMVDELAVAAGTRAPDEIRVVPEVNAAVWEQSRLLGLSSGRRFMKIGLPLLAGLNVSELRAVLAHELGHFGHGHTRLSALTYRATMTVGQTVERLDGVFGWLFGLYARLYARVSQGANRAQELQADLVAARAAGPRALGSALRKMPGMDEAWDFFSANYVALSADARRTPDLLGGFKAFLADSTRRRQLAEIATELLDQEPASPFDSHPPTSERLKALSGVQDDGREFDDRPALAVLRKPDKTVPLLEGELLAEGLGPRASWDEIVRLAGAATAKANAAAFSAAAVKAGVVRTGSVGELLDAVERGEGLRIARLLVAYADDVDEVIVALLYDSAVAAMIDRDAARHELDWGGPWRIRLADGTVLKPDATATELRRTLVELSVPLDTTPEPVPALA